MGRKKRKNEEDERVEAPVETHTDVKQRVPDKDHNKRVKEVKQEAVTTTASQEPESEKPVRTSRLCIKNIPAQATEEKLRQAFSAASTEVTDVKIMKTKDGKSRKFAFVGFKTEEGANRALDHFNQTFMGTNRLSVEYALPPGSAQLHRPWSKYSEGSSRHKEETGKSGPPAVAAPKPGKQGTSAKDKEELRPEFLGMSPEQVEQLKKDSKFTDFLEAIKPRSQTKFWANDDVAAGAAQTKMTKEQAEAVDIHDSDDEYFENPQVSEPSKEGKGKEKAKELSDKEYLLSKKTTNFDSDSDEEEKEIEKGVPTKTSAKAAVVGNTKQGEEDGEDGEEDGEDKSNAKKRKVGGGGGGGGGGTAAEKGKPKVKVSESEEKSHVGERREGEYDVMDSGRLLLKNLPYAATDQDIRAVFGSYGEISEVHIPVDSSTKKSRGIAFVLYTLPEHAAKARMEQDGSFFQGRILHVMGAAPKRGEGGEDDNSGSTETKLFDDDDSTTMSYKKKKEKQRKQEASKEDNWNSLFMRSDTVAEAIANKHQVKKSEILDRESSNMAVRVALAETHLIKETKDFLREQGVSLDAFSGSKRGTQRSGTVILVKNIPFDTEVDELKRLFAKFGSLGRVVLPPSKTVAMVEYLDPTEAKVGFQNLAYKKFKYVPLYLEWAPTTVFSEPAGGKNNKNKAVVKADKPVDALDEEGGVGGDDEKDDELESGSLFVKNLNFSTTTESLRKVFNEIGTLRNVTIAKKKNPRPTGTEDQYQSMGYGFVEFRDKADAERALRVLQHVDLDGHQLQLKVSRPGAGQSGGAEEEGKGAKKKNKNKNTAAAGGTNAGGDLTSAPSSKMLVKNLPFEATVKELRELVAGFAQVKAVRLPRKFGNAHRGFAFVDFPSRQEALTAYNALKHTHFYGRHLVLEWASETEGGLAGVEARLGPSSSSSSSSSVSTSEKKREESRLLGSNKSFWGAKGGDSA